MAKLFIEASKKTPEVDLDQLSGILTISGMSCSENAMGFFTPIFEWIADYVNHPQESTTLNFKLKYYNTSSAKCILDILDKLLVVKDAGKQLTVNWYYDAADDEMLESGENYSTILDHPFNMIEA
ncbi:MAG: hypothetical protein RL711_432 [Bacteroidota bacterium]|jgi:hypothetical protein